MKIQNKINRIYTPGGRVIASSNLVIPTMLSKQSPQSKDWGLFCFLCPDACINGHGRQKDSTL